MATAAAERCCKTELLFCLGFFDRSPHYHVPEEKKIIAKKSLGTSGGNPIDRRKCVKFDTKIFLIIRSR